MKKTWILIGILFTTLMAWAASDRDLNAYNLIFKESGGTDTVTIHPPSLSAPYTLTLPVDDGTANQVLQTDGSGVLAWATVSTTAWNQDGNTVGSEKWIGAIDNFDFPIRTNNTERMVVKNDGTVGIGGDPSSAKFQVTGQADVVQTKIKANGTQTADLVNYLDSSANVLAGYAPSTFQQNYFAGAANSIVQMHRANTSLTSPSVVASGNTLGAIKFFGHDGTVYRQAAEIDANVDATPGSNDMPGSLLFKVSPDGSSTVATALTIANTKAATFAGALTSTGALVVSDTTDSSSISTGSFTTLGGAGITKSLYVGGTTNQLGTGTTTTSGYTLFSGNLYTGATGTADTEKVIRLASNTYNSTNGPARSASLTGGQIEISARNSSTNGTILFRANTTADGTTTSPTLIAFADANGKWTFGASAGTQDHQVNGSWNTTTGVTFSQTSPGNSTYAHHSKGSFTTAVTGYAAVNVTCKYERADNVATVQCPIITGTSNSANFRIPLPAQLQTSITSDQEFLGRSCVDNGVSSTAPGCLVYVPSSGTFIDLRFNYSSGTTWTASGTKTFNGFVITYLIQ